MAIFLTCPNGHKLSVPDEHAGKKARCSVCKTVVPIPAPQAPVVIEEAIMPMEITDVREPQAMMITDIHEEEAMTPVLEDGNEADYVMMSEARGERRTKKRKKKDPAKIEEKKERRKRRNRIQGVRMVNLGLAFHYVWHIGFLVLLLVDIGVLISVYMAFLTRSVGGLEMARVFTYVALFDAAAIMPIMGLVGSILGIWVPAEAKGRPLIIVSLALDAALFPMIPVFFFAQLGEAGYYVIFGFVAVLVLASWVMFMLFVKTVAEYLDEWSISRDAINSIFKGLFYLVGTIVVSVLLRLLLKAVAPLMQYMITYIVFLMVTAVIFILMILWIWVLVKFVMSLLDTIASLRQIIYSRF